MKVSEKNVAGIIIYAVLYIAIIYGSLCLGYLHPFFWVYASVVSSLFAGIPFLYITSKWHKFGVGTLLAVLMAGACMLAGEGTALNYVTIIVTGIVVDVIRSAIGNDRIAGVRAAYLLFALLPFGRTMVIWTDRANEIAGQAAEMGEAYGKTMEAITSWWMLIFMILLTVILAFAAMRVTEKVMKKSAMSFER